MAAVGSTAAPPATPTPSAIPQPDGVPTGQQKTVIVRTQSAGCFMGEIIAKKATPAGMVVNLINARRLWYWAGAASLSQLAVDGTASPGECKFPPEVPHIELIQAIEIIDVTAKARASIKAVPLWKA